MGLCCQSNTWIMVHSYFSSLDYIWILMWGNLEMCCPLGGVSKFPPYLPYLIHTHLCRNSNTSSLNYHCLPQLMPPCPLGTHAGPRCPIVRCVNSRCHSQTEFYQSTVRFRRYQLRNLTRFVYLKGTNLRIASQFQGVTMKMRTLEEIYGNSGM